MKKIAAIIYAYIKETDRWLLLMCVSLSTFSVVLISGLYQSGIFGDSIRPLVMQAAASAMGAVAAIIISKLDYHSLAGLWKLHVPASYLLVLLTFTSLGVQVSDLIDDRAWLDLPGLPQFQPSELLKISFILTFAYHLSQVKDRLNHWKTLLLVCAHGAMPVLLIHFQGDDGTALVFALIFVGMVFCAGLSWKYILPVVAAVPPAFWVAWQFILDDDKKKRILSLVMPQRLTADELSRYLWQQQKGEIAIGNGGVWGNGIFNHTGQFQFVPEVHNDFMFSFIGEAVGFVGSMAVLTVLMAVCLKILYDAKSAQDDLGRYICVGVFTMIAVQIVINVGMCLSMFPVVGITLPFLSAGGTSQASLYLSIGLVLSVYVHSRKNLFMD